MVQVLETVGGSSFFSDADGDALEAIARFVQGTEATCSDECSLDKLQVGALVTCCTSDSFLLLHSGTPLSLGRIRLLVGWNMPVCSYFFGLNSAVLQCSLERWPRCW